MVLLQVVLRGLYFKIADLIDFIISNSTAKRKLAILGSLHCGQFVKNTFDNERFKGILRKVSQNLRWEPPHPLALPLRRILDPTRTWNKPT